jgi:hypothetical protein
MKTKQIAMIGAAVAAIGGLVAAGAWITEQQAQQTSLAEKEAVAEIMRKAALEEDRDRHRGWRERGNFTCVTPDHDDEPFCIESDSIQTHAIDLFDGTNWHTATQSEIDEVCKRPGGSELRVACLHNRVDTAAIAKWKKDK